MTWTARDIPDLHGRVAVVTGGNGGLGRETARELARAGAHVVVAARNQDKAEEASRDIQADVADASLEIRELDLASLDSVRACAEKILAEHDRLDLLVNNAGLMGIPEQATEDGFEMQLGVNHLGHFVLTARLFPALLRAPAPRVVSVTSFARHSGPSVDPDNPHMRGRYAPWAAYGRSKLANLHFALELDRRTRDAGAPLASLAAHPGLTHTDLQARSVRETDGGWSQKFWHVAAQSMGMSPARGALPILRAATDPDAEGGQLYTPTWVVSGAPVVRPVIGRPGQAQAMRRLWEVSERETGERFDVSSLVGRAA